jgi:signal transduction histidine kinase
VRLPRGIFVKLVLVFLLIGLLPLALIGVVTYTKAKERMTETVIEYWLVRLARDTADDLDRRVREMSALVRSWADDAFLGRLLAEQDPGGADNPGLDPRFRSFLQSRRNYRTDLDLLLLVSPTGAVLAESWAEPSGSEGAMERLRGQQLDLLLDAADWEWIAHALEPTPEALRQKRVPVSSRDWHVSPLVRRARGLPPWRPEEGYPKSEHDYALGFASTVLADRRTRPAGALVAIFNWASVHELLDQVGTRFGDAGPREAGRPRYSSGYPFLFAQDADTIIGHHFRTNLGTSLVRDHRLPDLRARIEAEPYGSHQYEYPPGTAKISGFARTAGPEREGFGWVVGVGINHDQVYADVRGLFEFLMVAALITAGIVILLAALFSHRITEPITRLIAYTEEVGRGNLDARVEIDTEDEIAVLADSFNRMAEEVKETNRRLIRAEKDAAWKEMARQVAHEIKNPLTPIVLSAQQLRAAWADSHPRFAAILKDAVDTIIDQAESLRKIAADFGSFATFGSRSPAEEALAPLVAGAVDIYRPRLAGGAIRMELVDRSPPGTQVFVDRTEIRRVFLNLFNNALEAMEGGEGRITVKVEVEGGPARAEARISIADTGPGIPPEVMARIFEPYFSTRTKGTGLGLAICKRIVEESGGRITVASELGSGTTFTLVLPAIVPPPAPAS